MGWLAGGLAPVLEIRTSRAAHRVPSITHGGDDGPKIRPWRRWKSPDRVMSFKPPRRETTEVVFVDRAGRCSPRVERAVIRTRAVHSPTPPIRPGPTALLLTSTKVVALVHVLDQAWVVGLPPQQFLRARGRCGTVELDDRGEKSEVVVRGARFEAAHADAKVAGDGAGDLSERDPSSPTACSRLPATAFSRASRNRRAASRVCTAGQRLVPSPT